MYVGNFLYNINATNSGIVKPKYLLCTFNEQMLVIYFLCYSLSVCACDIYVPFARKCVVYTHRASYYTHNVYGFRKV